jgi:hypothetical protein
MGLFDYLVDDLAEMHWNVEAQRLGRIEVDDKLISRRCLHRHVGWLLALKDAVDITGRTPIQVDPIRPIGHQTTGGGKGAIEVYRWQLASGRKRDDEIAMNESRPTRGHNQSAIWSSPEGRDGALDLAGIVLVE